MKRLRVFLAIFLLGAYLGACAPMAAPEIQKPASTVVEAVKTVEVEVVQEGSPTLAPLPTSVPEGQTTPLAPPSALPSAPPTSTHPPPAAYVSPIAPSASAPAGLPAATQERLHSQAHIVEVEWPRRIRLGESDIVRMSLNPFSEGYIVTTEFPDHTTITSTIQIAQMAGYELYAVGRLDGVGFSIAPSLEVVQYFPLEEQLTWRWSITPEKAGKQRLSITLTLRWVPLNGISTQQKEIALFSSGLDVQVLSLLGLTHQQAMFGGLLGVIFGGGLSLAAFVFKPVAQRRLERAIETQAPNMELAIEIPEDLSMSNQEERLLRTIFRRYARLVIEKEFLSGYSGARTFLVLPVLSDGRSDAHTIAKLGEIGTIRREYDNYEIFVKDRLPPITARIQHPPVTTSQIERKNGQEPLLKLAALQYTFIGKPGSSPTSMRQALLENPDPQLLSKLIDTFGANWWLQRKPYSFRLGVEYDRMLPTHFVVAPEHGQGLDLDGRAAPGSIAYKVGDLVTLRNFDLAEVRSDGRSLSLAGIPPPGQPHMRVRWLSRENPDGATGRIIATRQTLLENYVEGLDLFGFQNPFENLSALLSRTVRGSLSTIHGDLNLENILLGPGEMIWLIDFAQTREGHVLYDFAHLEAEIIAHIYARGFGDPRKYVQFLTQPRKDTFPVWSELHQTLRNIAARCLFDTTQPKEYTQALAMACLGALKFNNLESHQKHLLYLTGAHLVERL